MCSQYPLERIRIETTKYENRGKEKTETNQQIINEINNMCKWHNVIGHKIGFPNSDEKKDGREKCLKKKWPNFSKLDSNY